MADEIIEGQELTPKIDPLDTAWDAATAKAAELTIVAKGRAIIPFVLTGESEDDFVTGYFYEPDGITDAKLMAAKLSGAEVSFPKAINALESLILFDQSDARCNQKKYMNGAALVLLASIEIAMPTAKKK